MRIIEPKRSKPKANRRWKHRLQVINAVLLSVILLYSSILALRYVAPLPSLEATQKHFVAKSTAVPINWPTSSQAAIGAVDYGLLASKNQEAARPIASITKVLTALTILQKKPLAVGETGPVITFNDEDITLYENYMSKGGSVVKVVKGQQMTELQALQAMLLPSANNIADSLGLWAYGSLEAYTAAANSLAQSYGMSSTHVDDASGFSPKSIGTANDLVLLGQKALSHPVLAGIISLRLVDIPLVGTVYNVNKLLGRNGVVGVKTGNTDEAGGCFLVASNYTTPDGQKLQLVASVLGASSLEQAMKDSLQLVDSMKAGFATRVVAQAHQVVGYYNVPWGGVIPVSLEKDISVFGWLGAELKPKVSLRPLKADSPSSSSVGTVKVSSGPNQGQSDVFLTSPIPQPTNEWRLRRAFSW